jgi:hypothetical protein
MGRIRQPRCHEQKKDTDLLFPIPNLLFGSHLFRMLHQRMDFGLRPLVSLR